VGLRFHRIKWRWLDHRWEFYAPSRVAKKQALQLRSTNSPSRKVLSRTRTSWSRYTGVRRLQQFPDGGERTERGLSQVL
jgi:hypothetical protein